MLRNTSVDVHLRPVRSEFLSGMWALTLAAASVCVTATAADSQLAAAPPHFATEARVDTGIQPGDDFFANANGAWLKATEIPATKERWNARTEIEELTRQQIARLIDDATAAPAGSDARKVADFRAAYLNDAAIEARGL